MLTYIQTPEGNCTLEITAIGTMLVVRELCPYYCPQSQLKKIVSKSIHSLEGTTLLPVNGVKMMPKIQYSAVFPPQVRTETLLLITFA
jgi:hypothetical protein